MLAIDWLFQQRPIRSQTGWTDYTAAEGAPRTASAARQPARGREYVPWHQSVAAGARDACYLAPSVDHLVSCCLSSCEDASVKATNGTGPWNSSP